MSTSPRKRAAAPGTGTWSFPLEIAGTTATLKVIKRTQNRALRLSVREDHLRVSAPPRVSHAQVLVFVRQHEAWIRTRLRQVPALPPVPVPFVTDRIPCGGRDVRLSWEQGDRLRWEPVDDGVRFVLPRSYPGRWPQGVRALLIQYWRHHMEKVIALDRDVCIAHLGRSPVRVTFKRVKSLWGSLSSHDHVMLDLALALAPPDVLRYVWIHELCHLRERNHSARFWDWVSRFCPTWKSHRDWLSGPGGFQIKAVVHAWLG